MNITPSSARPVTASAVVASTPTTFRGLSIKDTSAAGNTIKVYDNPSAASGTILFERVLAANADVTVMDPSGVRGASGLYFSSTGSVEGSVFIS